MEGALPYGDSSKKDQRVINDVLQGFGYRTADAFSASTASDWYKTWRKNQNWRPYDPDLHSLDSRASIFVQEQVLSGPIQIKYIDKQCAVTHWDLWFLAIERFKQ
jgi:hypothetical protein